LGWTLDALGFGVSAWEREREGERERERERESDFFMNTNTHRVFRGTLLIRERLLLGPYSRALWWSWGGGRFFMSEVPL
jgi:hypothetical protein